MYKSRGTDTNRKYDRSKLYLVSWNNINYQFVIWYPCIKMNIDTNGHNFTLEARDSDIWGLEPMNVKFIENGYFQIKIFIFEM